VKVAFVRVPKGDEAAQAKAARLVWQRVTDQSLPPVTLVHLVGCSLDQFFLVELVKLAEGSDPVGSVTRLHLDSNAFTSASFSLLARLLPCLPALERLSLANQSRAADYSAQLTLAQAVAAHSALRTVAMEWTEAEPRRIVDTATLSRAPKKTPNSTAEPRKAFVVAGAAGPTPAERLAPVADAVSAWLTDPRRPFLLLGLPSDSDQVQILHDEPADERRANGVVDTAAALAASVSSWRTLVHLLSTSLSPRFALAHLEYTTRTGARRVKALAISWAPDSFSRTARLVAGQLAGPFFSLGAFNGKVQADCLGDVEDYLEMVKIVGSFERDGIDEEAVRKAEEEGRE
jgi:hypothetical protein